MNPYDEKSIAPNDVIIRRINLKQHVVPDMNSGRNRVSSKAFKPSSKLRGGGMSVDIEALIKSSGHVPQEFITTPDFIGAVKFKASYIRSLGLIIGYAPIANNPYHGEVWPVNANPWKFTKNQTSSLHRACEWYVQIPDVDLV